jgi:hypothetical protein
MVNPLKKVILFLFFLIIAYFMSTILAEILWAAFVAEHNLPFTIMEHLPQAAAKAYPDSKIAADVACGRKKTTAITTVEFSGASEKP